MQEFHGIIPYLVSPVMQARGYHADAGVGLAGIDGYGYLVEQMPGTSAVVREQAAAPPGGSSCIQQKPSASAGASTG